MNQLLNKQRKVIAFLIWTLWIPMILFSSYLLISTRSSSIFPFLLLSLALFFISLAVGRISMRLENEIKYTTRIIKQFLHGFLIPLFLVIILAILYDTFIDDNAIQRVRLGKDLTIILTYLYVANSFYLVMHIDRQISIAALLIKEEKRYHHKVVVYHKGAYGPVNLMEIALINQSGQINWLITFTEEEHILDLSLKEINIILGEKQFFKINRSQIVNKDAISKFRSASFGKIELELSVNEIKTTISKDRAKDFRKWFYK